MRGLVAAWGHDSDSRTDDQVMGIHQPEAQPAAPDFQFEYAHGLEAADEPDNGPGQHAKLHQAPAQPRIAIDFHQHGLGSLSEAIQRAAAVVAKMLRHVFENASHFEVKDNSLNDGGNDQDQTTGRRIRLLRFPQREFTR